jgi:hypothetical protein
MNGVWLSGHLHPGSTSTYDSGLTTIKRVELVQAFISQSEGMYDIIKH